MAPCRKLHLIRSRTESISSRLLPETLSHLHEYHYVRSVRAGPLVDVVAVFSEKDACRAVVRTTDSPTTGDRFQPLIYLWVGRRGPVLSRGTLFCDRPNFTQYRSFYAGPGRFEHAQGRRGGVLRAHRRPGRNCVTNFSTRAFGLVLCC